MILTINIGNTNASLVWFERGEALAATRVAVGDISGSERLNSAIGGVSGAETVVVGSVVPKATEAVRGFFSNKEGIAVFEAGVEFAIPLENTCEHPSSVGVDRLLNALAASEITGGAALVVDAGTALTIDVIDDQRRFLGGIIAPGMEMAARSLSEYTARLPKVEAIFPKTVLGKNTVGAIQAGVTFGWVGLVDYLVEQLMKETSSAPVIGTGGAIEGISMRSRYVMDLRPDLTNIGLRIAFENKR